jgi:peptidoglycan/LPS O-acetylase OafA/YrhL/GT2 family glycosyltransferase
MKNNLDIVRLFAALLVLYSHGFTLLGLPEPLFLSWIPLGPLGVYIFFAISGYLIARSWDSDPNLLRYFARRSLRIFPALIVCTLLSIFVLGPLLTTWTLDRYFSSQALRYYFLNIVLYVSYYLPGVFEHNHIPNAVNGSLWSLPAEFFMYIVVVLNGLLFRASRWAYLALFAFFAAACVLWVDREPNMLVVYATDVRQVFLTGIYFLSGACLHKFGLRRFLSVSTITAAFVALLCLTHWPQALRVAMWLLLPWIAVGFGLAFSSSLRRLVKTGDYSYGIYIYAFPMQQTIASLFPGIDVMAFFVLVCTLTFALAILSWHWVEKPLLSLKPVRPGPDAPAGGPLRNAALAIYRWLPQKGGVKACVKTYLLATARRLGGSLESAENQRALATLLKHRDDDPRLEFLVATEASPADVAVDLTVVTYNSSKWLPGLFDSLRRQCYPLHLLSLYVVDHGSTDDSIAILDDLRRQHGQQLRRFEVYSRPNLGFGTGHNFAIAQGDAPFVLITNPDLEFEANAISRVIALAKVDDERTASWELRQKPYEHPKHYDPVTLETNWSSHACVLLRRTAWQKIGGYDESIFLYAEDVEYSYRLRSSGYRLRYCPSAVVWHYTYEHEAVLKPAQYIGSLVGNLHVRLRFGRRRDMLAALAIAMGALLRAEPFPGAQRQLLLALVALMRRVPAILLSRRPTQAYFPFRGLDYEFIREGAFVKLQAQAVFDPMISIVTRTYRGRHDYLRQAAAAVFNQTYGNLEWIVIEDGGDTLKDEFAEICKGAPCRVRYFPLDKVGRSRAGNEGLQQARGEWAMFLDDDDLLYADHVEVLAAALAANKACVAAYSLSWLIPTHRNTDGSLTEGDYSTPTLFHQTYDYQVLMHHNFIPIQAVLFERALFVERGGFDTELDQLEDWNLWLRYGYRNQFAYVAKTTSLFRVPADAELMAQRQALLDTAYRTAAQRASAWREEYDQKIGRDAEGCLQEDSAQ